MLSFALSHNQRPSLVFVCLSQAAVNVVDIVFLNFFGHICVCVFFWKEGVIVCVAYTFTFNQLHKQMYEWVSRHNTLTG